MPSRRSQCLRQTQHELPPLRAILRADFEESVEVQGEPFLGDARGQGDLCILIPLRTRAAGQRVELGEPRSTPLDQDRLASLQSPPSLTMPPTRRLFLLVPDPLLSRARRYS